MSSAVVSQYFQRRRALAMTPPHAQQHTARLRPRRRARERGRRARRVLHPRAPRWFCFPLFHLQLDAATHGVHPALAFDSPLGVVNIILAASGCGVAVLLVLCMIALRTFALQVVAFGIAFGFVCAARGRG
ncbi:hypothetical protein GGX14DRAFT_383858 [Mycena pura]|uniref:Uncharacterized protein n=1 Tax=Mycena pura TaxID=153505 RepID=A0AAD6YU92_9AGAR|nr:hypothetical protein GGX14DRAFT_383858 [Mycena pura]